MRLDMRTIEAMASAGIDFVVNISVPGGGQDIILRSEEVPIYLADKEQCAAEHFGVKKAQYLEWLEHDGRPRCGGTTANGRRCKNYLSGASQQSISAWMRRDGGFCVTHGGEDSEEARASHSGRHSIVTP